MEMKAKKRFFIQTFGCQMNVNDSEKVAGLLEARGYEAAEGAHDADFVFLNTCAVREKASLKFRQSLVRLGRLKKGRPELKIGVGGCVAQLEGPAVVDGSPQVDVVVGTHTLRRIPELLDQAAESGRVAIDLDRGADAFDVPDAVTAHANPVRAYVTAMEGCNLVCSFCVVPRTRGPEVNRPPDDIVAEVEAVVARGFPEVMLLGQTVNAYRSSGHDFADLLARVDAVAGPPSAALHDIAPEPRHTADGRRLPRPAARVPLPAPAGPVGLGPRAEVDAPGLHARRSTSTRSPCCATACPASRSRATSSSATRERPRRSSRRRCRFSRRSASTGSSRSPTRRAPAPRRCGCADDVPEAEKKHRLHVVNGHQQQWQRRRNEALVGTRDEVLVETLDGDGRVSGRTPHFRIVHFEGPDSLLGQTVSVEITRSGPNSLQGTLSQLTH